jgi:hypothetical protein
MAPQGHLQATGQPEQRALSESARNQFFIWTAAWWSGVGVMAILFFVGVLDFVMSARLALYGISIWLNAWILIWVLQKDKSQDTMQLYHDLLVVWMLSYAITNVLWEMPWVIFSPIVFQDLHTLEDVVAYTDYMRESIINMYWWILASFGAVDLRTVNHDPTFYTIEIYSFVNLATTFYFFHLNKKRSPYRYLVAVLGCGEPVAATFVFTFAEVFSGFVNMPGGVADTLLALVWTQYQYFFFPLVFGYIGYQLLLNDWQNAYLKNPGKAEPAMSPA